MRNVLFLILSLVFTVSSSHADNEKKLSKKKLIEQADYYFFKENFPKALELYEKILINYPKNHYVQYHQYVAHHLTNGRGTDLTGLQEFEKNEGQTDKFYNYWLGRIHYGRYEFELAEEHFKAFLALDIYKTKEIIRESKQRLKRAIKAKEFYLSPNEFEVELLSYPINSEYADVSPAFFSDHDELLFVSSRPDVVNQEIAKNSYCVFHTKKNGKVWGTPSSLKSIGPLEKNCNKIEVVNEDGRLFIYNGELNDLFYSEPQGDDWSKPIEFDTDLQNRKIGSHFFINDRENLIFFSSKSANGRLDLYQSHKDPQTHKWEDPFPVLGGVNSKYDEDSPFLSHDGNTLYFSSNRSESVGGFDIYKSEWDNNLQEWGKPVNMGFPINTTDDELNFELNEDNISGFISSNRLHGRGDFDIYHFHKQGKVLAQGTVFEKETGKALTNIQLDFHPQKYKDETFRSYTSDDGSFSVEILQEEDFIVEFSINGQVIYKESVISKHEELKKTFSKDFHITVPDQLDKKTDFIALYDTSKPEAAYEKVNMLGSKFRTGEKAMLKNVYFDLHSAHLKNESQDVLETLFITMKDNSTLKIEIGGHTDSTGTADSNNQLSKARAESVKKYLVSKGIESNRITTKGYGSSQPLASNDDEADGRELNRRIEVIVMN
ncbi:OmpA family protein [Reichenbachiella versicolor]|uniref:OmpA family protein n=1 Tax=Reichenbachiella versicolor TaxID=1821036 RepID=UPI000D6E5828|nr:OmpA family protein [Reichenbachiella versicolor]